MPYLITNAALKALVRTGKAEIEEMDGEPETLLLLTESGEPWLVMSEKTGDKG